MKMLLLILMSMLPIQALAECVNACEKVTIKESVCKFGLTPHKCIVYTCGDRSLYVITNQAEQVSMVFVSNSCEKDRVLYFKKETQM